ncbi:MAG: hypothetical protein A3J28_15330 [Acidobacteria bacterium RIFCSPLOWO2_12_FULL_60_22]|nr:MAG: hypothetical protein A3J28_15330 [Acidobacteria bacterium RIFCSPLOWO2_12_FULL_60_22]
MSKEATGLDRLPNLIRKTIKAAMEEKRERLVLLPVILIAELCNSFLDQKAAFFTITNVAIVMAVFLAGTRHGVTSPLLYIFVVVLLGYYDPQMFSFFGPQWPPAFQLASLGAWAGLLLLTASLVVTLKSRNVFSRTESRAVKSHKKSLAAYDLLLATITHFTQIERFVKRPQLMSPAKSGAGIPVNY